MSKCRVIYAQECIDCPSDLLISLEFVLVVDKTTCTIIQVDRMYVNHEIHRTCLLAQRTTACTHAKTFLSGSVKVQAFMKRINLAIITSGVSKLQFNALAGRLWHHRVGS